MFVTMLDLVTAKRGAVPCRSNPADLPESLLPDRAVNDSATIAIDKYILHEDLASLETEMTGWAKMHAKNLTSDENI